MKKLFIAILFLFLVPNIAFAFEKRIGDSVVINSDETINGSLFVNSSVLDIEGVVNGDVFCITSKLEVSGTVNGDIICVGEKVNYTGTTTGDLRLGFREAEISGTVNGNTNIVADILNTSDTAKLNREFLVLSNNANLAGVVGSDMYGMVRNANISSFIGGNLSFRQSDGFFAKEQDKEFKLLSGATIEGDINFKSDRDLVKEEGVVLVGEENKTILKAKKESYSNNIFWALVLIFSNILIAFVLIALFRKFVLSVGDIIEKQSVKSIWLGILLFFLFPLTFILLLLTMIGIPLAVILLFIFIGIILINKSIISIVLGKRVLNLLKNKKKVSLNSTAVIGAIVFYILANLPYIGSFLSFTAMIIVLGATIQYFRTKLSK